MLFFVVLLSIIKQMSFLQTPNLKLQASRTFAFYFQKTRCAHIFFVLSPGRKCQEISGTGYLSLVASTALFSKAFCSTYFFYTVS